MSKAFHRATTKFRKEDFALVVDGVLPCACPDCIADALSLLHCFCLCHVGVHRDLDVLERRGRGRADRIEGWAQEQFQKLHDGVVYNVWVDANTTGLDENADKFARYFFRQDAKLVRTKPNPAI